MDHRPVHWGVVPLLEARLPAREILGSSATATPVERSVDRQEIAEMAIGAGASQAGLAQRMGQGPPLAGGSNGCLSQKLGCFAGLS